MAKSATATAFDEDVSSMRSIGRGNPVLRGQTIPDKEPAQRGAFFLNKKDAVRNTDPFDSMEEESISLGLSTKPARVSQQAVLPEPQNVLDGAVLAVEGETVLCELFTGPNPIAIRLPLVLFDFPLTRGTPFKLSIEEQNGVKRPVVVAREVQRLQPDDIDSQIATLISALN
jgi:hypothetical protein